MPNRYFENFPTIAYANNYAVNITERVGILNSVLQNPYVYLPLVNVENERPDSIADRYYEDQYLSWMIYLANKTIDPYYSWCLDEEQFNDSIKKKYNVDVYTLQQKVAFYRNNWYENTGTISVADFEALTLDLQKYWEPVYNSSYTPIGYSRKQNDWVTNTNEVFTYYVDGSGFVKNEIVDIVFNNTTTGRGQVVLGNTSVLTLQHMYGTVNVSNTVSITASSYLYGRESTSNVNFTANTTGGYSNNILLVSVNLPPTENTYWSPVTIYDYERESNENNKVVNILNKSYIQQTATEIKKLLASNG